MKDRESCAKKERKQGNMDLDSEPGEIAENKILATMVESIMPSP